MASLELSFSNWKRNRTGAPSRDSFNFGQLSPVKSTYSKYDKTLYSGRKVGCRHYSTPDTSVNVVDLKPIILFMTIKLILSKTPATLI